MLSEISQTQERKILCDVSFMVSLHFKNYRNKSAFKGWLGVRGTLVKRYKVVSCLDLGSSVVLALGKQRKKNQELGSFVCIVNVRPAWCTGYSVSHNHKIEKHNHSHEETFTCLTSCPSTRA